jgi:hypothetical protein
MFIYTLRKPVKYNKKKEFYGHMIFFLNQEKRLVPKKFSPENINPEQFNALKKKLRIKKILIEDRLSTSLKNRCIIDHVNKAGFNFLYGKTPFLTFPTFPDMSFIYKPLKGLKTIKVHTLGPDRFKKSKHQKFIYSEISGLISPVWHYINVIVSAKTV